MDKVEIVVRRVEKDLTEEKVVASFENAKTSNPVAEAMTFPGLEIFLNQQNVYRDGELIPLTSHEFHTLVYLASHPGWVCRPDAIYENVWQEPSENIGTAVAHVISQLRHKLTPDNPKDGYIHTIIGEGYKFIIPE